MPTSVGVQGEFSTHPHHNSINRKSESDSIICKTERGLIRGPVSFKGSKGLVQFKTRITLLDVINKK